MAFRYLTDLDEYGEVTTDMLYDGLDIAEERGDLFEIATIGLEAMFLEGQAENTEEIDAFEEVWVTASGMLARLAISASA